MLAATSRVRNRAAIAPVTIRRSKRVAISSVRVISLVLRVATSRVLSRVAIVRPTTTTTMAVAIVLVAHSRELPVKAAVPTVVIPIMRLTDRNPSLVAVVPVLPTTIPMLNIA